MAAVAPDSGPALPQSAPMAAEPTAAELEAATAANTAANAATSGNTLDAAERPDEPRSPRGEDDEPDDDDHEDAGAPKEWDEGGRSHCGYSDSVHDTLMAIGETIHRVVGDPGDGAEGVMKGVGNWFQEASYAVRDARRGELDVKGEAREAMKSVVSRDDEDDDKDEERGEKEGGDDAEEAATPDMGGGLEEVKLVAVKEDESGKEGSSSAA